MHTDLFKSSSFWTHAWVAPRAYRRNASPSIFRSHQLGKLSLSAAHQHQRDLLLVICRFVDKQRVDFVILLRHLMCLSIKIHSFAIEGHEERITIVQLTEIVVLQRRMNMSYRIAINTWIIHGTPMERYTFIVTSCGLAVPAVINALCWST